MTFTCAGRQELPETLLPYLRLAHCADAGALKRGDAFAPDAPGAQRDVAVEGAALGQLITHLRSRLAGCARHVSAGLEVAVVAVKVGYQALFCVS